MSTIQITAHIDEQVKGSKYLSAQNIHINGGLTI